MKKFSALALAFVAVVTLAGCSPFAVLSDRVEVHFADAVEFTEAAVPVLDGGVVPADAADIDAAYYSDEPDAMLAYSSPTGPAECVPGPLTGEPALESNWWPSTEPAEGTVCGDWQVFAIGERWYAWIN